MLERPPAPESGDDLQQTDETGPDRDQVQQDHDGKSGPDEGDHPHGDADQSLDEQQPPALRLPAFAHREPDRKEAVDQGERTEEHHEHGQGNPWPDKGAEAKQHGNQAAQGQHPPVAD